MIRCTAIPMQLRRLAAPLFCALAATLARAEDTAPAAKTEPRNVIIITNSATSDDRQLIEKMLERRLQRDAFKGWKSGQESLEGMAQMPQQRELNLTPEQQRRLKEMLDEQRLWMFASTDDKSEKNPFGDASKTDDSSDNEFDKNTPRILRKFYNRNSDNAGQTNGAARDQNNDRADPLALKPPGDLPGKISSASARVGISRSAFEQKDAPPGNAIARLFQKSDASSQPASVPSGLFGTTFASAFRPTMAENSFADKKRMDTFRQLLSPPITAPVALPSGGAFGGSANYSLPQAPSAALANPSGGASLFGGSSLPAIAPAAAPNVIDFQPMGAPKRRF